MGRTGLGVLMVGLVATVGCLEANEQTCDGVLCPADQACVPGRGCVDDALLRACDGADAFDACQAGGITDGICVGDDGVRQCVAAGCGNDVVEPGEACDDGNRLDDETCSADCGSEVACGNGVRDWNEGCDCGTDATALPGGCPTVNGDDPTAICRSDCSAAGCGDGQVVAPEDCEPDVALGAACGDLGYYGGTLGCLSTCRFDVSACSGRCGDGTVQAGEACEAAPLDVGGLTCGDFGYYGGALGCNGACGIDLSTCVGTCGDGVLEGPEDCEDGDLGDATCNDIGYYGGELGCNASCRFDAGACAGRCGDDVVDAVEQCDGSAPDFGCGDLGGVIDRPTCSIGCSADATACPTTRLATAKPGGARSDYIAIAPDDGSRWGVGFSDVFRIDDSGETAWPIANVNDLSVVSSTEAYAISCYGEVHAWDGSGWTQRRAATGPECYGSVAVVAHDGVLWAAREGALQRLTGGSWETVVVPPSTLTDLIVCGDRLFAVNYSNGVRRFDDPGWTSTGAFYGAWGGACDEATGTLWLTGEINGGGFARVDAQSMATTFLPMPEPDFPYFPFVFGPDRVFAAGYSTADFVWTGRRVATLSKRVYDSPGLYWTVAPGPTGGLDLLERGGRLRHAEMLVADYGTPDAYAVGTGALWEIVGTSLRLGGNDVATIPAGSKVWARDGSKAFVTAGTTVRRCTPAGCGAALTTSGQGVASVAVGDGDEAYAADGSTNFYRWDGAAWIRVTDLPIGLGRHVIVEPGHVFGLDWNGRVVEWQLGVGGVVRCDAPTCAMNAVGGRWPDAMFAVGGQGRIVMRDPATGAWNLVAHDLTDAALQQVVTAGDRLFVRGANDTVLQYDGAGWMRSNLSQVDAGITSLSGHADGSIWVRGQTGLYELVPDP